MNLSKKEYLDLKKQLKILNTVQRFLKSRIKQSQRNNKHVDILQARVRSNTYSINLILRLRQCLKELYKIQRGKDA